MLLSPAVCVWLVVPAPWGGAWGGRLIARKDEDADEAGAGNGAGEPLRHRYLLEPVDANARVALSVDPSDR